MNVSLKEFQRLIQEEKGVTYLWLTDLGARLSFRIDDFESYRNNFDFDLATQMNKTRYFKTIKALNAFMVEYFPDTFFKTSSLDS